MIINATSNTIKNISKFFLFITIFLTIVILTLLQGIRIEKLSLPFVEVTQFYIKLDKKLIVSVKDAYVTSDSNTTTSPQDLLEYLDNLPTINSFFESIAIQNLQVGQNSMKLLFKEDKFYFENKDLSVDAKIYKESHDLVFEISELLYKEFDFELKGKITLDLLNEKYQLNGDYDIKDFKGKARILVEDGMVYYRLNASATPTIANFMDFLNSKVTIHPTVSNWIYKFIVAKNYKLNFIEGKFNLETYDFYPHLMRAEADIEDVIIKFNPDVPPAHAQKIKVTLKDDELHFGIENATYQKEPISQPDVYIYNLLTEDTGIVVELTSKALLNDEIHKILKAYKIKIPLIQSASVENLSHLKLKIDFYPGSVEAYHGEFLFKDSYAKLSDMDIYSKEGEIKMENEKLHFKNVHLQYNKLFSIYFSGILDTKTKHFEGSALLENINLDLQNTNLLHVENLETPVSFEIQKDGIQITLENLDTLLTFHNQGAVFEIGSIKKIKEYSSILTSLHVKDGRAFVTTQNYKEFDANASVDLLSSSLFSKENIPIEHFNLDIKATQNSFSLKDKSNKINLTYDKALKIALRDIDLKTNLSTSDKEQLQMQILLDGTNTNLVDTNSSFAILSESLHIESQKQKTKLQSIFKGKKFNYLSTPKTLQLGGENLHYQFINALLGSDTFVNGTYTIFIKGKSKDNFEGSITLKEATLKNLKFFNNLMAFINTVPSLITFKNPQFNEQGYEIKEGFISFVKKQNTIVIKDIKLKGYSADISGGGIYKTDSKSVDLNLQISTLKDISGVINKIPLIKDIFLGKEGRIYTSVKVKGSLEKPEIKTEILQDTLFTPVNIIKRTILLPFNW